LCGAPIISTLATIYGAYLRLRARHSKFPEDPMLARLTAAAALALSALTSQAYGADYTCKTVDGSWTWFSDHVVGSIGYLIVGPKDRTFRAGTGVFFRGRPWGSTSDGSGILRMTAYGMGALHIRQQDTGPPFKVCATSEKLDPLTIISTEF
jgi:hypothetical protein